MNRMSRGGRATSSRGTGRTPRGHHARHGQTASSAGDIANQLNQQELSQLQGGSPMQGGNPTTTNRMPTGGRATSGGQR
jgi:hypothetical protein